MASSPKQNMAREKTDEAMATVINLLKDNMQSLEDMEEERIRMIQKHEEDKEKLRQQLQWDWEEEKVALERKIDEVKAEMAGEMEEFHAECERKMAEEKADMEKKMAIARAESDQQKASMTQAMVDFRTDCEEKMLEEKVHMEKEMEHVREECARMAQEKEQMNQDIVRFRLECEQKMLQEKDDMNAKMAAARADCDQLAEEKATLTRQMRDFRDECERRMAEEKASMLERVVELRAECEHMAEEKERMLQDIEKFRVECEQKMAEDKLATERETEQFRLECERRLTEEKEAMRQRMSVLGDECQRMADEKASLSAEIVEFRQEYELKASLAREEAKKKTAEVQRECERKTEEEKAAGERRLAEARAQTEEQLRFEREVTDHIRRALRELPPLQAAMELGDLGQLQERLDEWSADALPERFGECKGVVEAVLRLARERLFTWRGLEHTLKDVLREVEQIPASITALAEHCHRLFRTLKEAQLTKLDIKRSDPKALDRICEVLLAWQERAMLNSNSVQRQIVRKVLNWPSLGPFDFVDLEICLRFVDRPEAGNEVMLSRAKTLVEDESLAPKDMRSLLSHLETMLFFLKYTKAEDLRLTHTEFRKQVPKLDAIVREYIVHAERVYPPGSELVQFRDNKSLLEKGEVAAVLQDLRKPRGKTDALATFREIFYQWAVAMRSKFDLLVLPHHTQVVCLLAFQRFLEITRTGAAGPHALIAQVGTGEGKSMIIAALAVYVVVALGKQVHIVVDDETLLERDFWTFKSLFDMFKVPNDRGQPGRQISAVLCVSEERLAVEKGTGRSCLSSRIPAEADICYCEAKHVQSFYASIARGSAKFSGYEDRVLILDEVDALVIDEEPNEAFVYQNDELCQMASSVAASLAGKGPASVLPPSHPAAPRLLREMTSEWERGRHMKSGEEFVYQKELGRYCLLQAGRVNPKAWSLALECRNYQDGFSREIVFKERLFVMSRPRVFRKYFKILGLSGSIGSEAERDFLTHTYNAAYFEVPPFLKTCRGSPYHEPVPAELGQHRRAVYVEPSVKEQLSRIAEVALEAREHVPVLVIARDRICAEHIVEGLRHAARSRGLGAISEDVVRSLSRTLYEADPEQWKENLNRSTLPLGAAGGSRKSWRVTVTDPRGGRGTDYRVDDPDVDGRGGLLLIPTVVPSSQRDWTQFLGRTARQDRKGQYCTVLCVDDYAALAAKFGEKLPAIDSLETINTVLSWGNRDVASRIQGSAALYNCGVRVNEVCEEIFGRMPAILNNTASRELLVDVCQRYRWMSVREIDEALSRIDGFQSASVPTQARDLGRPAEPPQMYHAASRSPSKPSSEPKVVIFCLDWSCSMMSRDTGTPLSRFETCQACVRRVLKHQVHGADYVGVVGFGVTVETVMKPGPKKELGQVLDAKVSKLRPQWQGGTCFFDAVAECLRLLNQPGKVPSAASRWLVCLTDGDDLGSRRENANGEVVSAMVQRGIPANLNMVMITVGSLKDKNTRVIDSWVAGVKASGGVGLHVSEKDASAIGKAFDVVAECLAAEVGGAVEC